MKLRSNQPAQTPQPLQGDFRQSDVEGCLRGEESFLFREKRGYFRFLTAEFSLAFPSSPRSNPTVGEGSCVPVHIVPSARTYRFFDNLLGSGETKCSGGTGWGKVRFGWCWPSGQRQSRSFLIFRPDFRGCHETPRRGRKWNRDHQIQCHRHGTIVARHGAEGGVPGEWERDGTVS
jgi:hypothetical protein